ncbi:hypothetical protein [Streptomyces sp. W1SF4]|uniref:hypothetical protein n=1 Tax=Streptomyces sp. W1SF4 TaxID=2305220 RepID=UPI000F710D59|nr:hypothetical protein [Streptomyces sp. W1SF4]AZM91453.1 hypothetical protein D1J60_25705 [Streptomyces sp. W1SF4]
MTDQPEPICKFEQGCHRVAPCAPGCGAPLPAEPQPSRHTADTITDNDLDELYIRLWNALDARDAWAGKAEQQKERADQAEAALAKRCAACPRCDHACQCGHDQQDHSSSGWCNPCWELCGDTGHYPSDCPTPQE